MPSPGVTLPGPFVTAPSPVPPVASCWLRTSARDAEFEQGVLYGCGPAQVGFGGQLSSFHRLTLSSGGRLSPEPLRLTHPGGVTEERPQPSALPAVALSELVPSLAIVPPRGLHPWLLTAAPIGAGCISRQRSSQGFAPLAMDCRPDRGWLDLSSTCLPGVCTPGY